MKKSKKDTSCTRDFFKETLKEFKQAPRYALDEIRKLARCTGIIDYSDSDVAGFYLDLCFHDDCLPVGFCMQNPLERRYQRFICRFGEFTKIDYLFLRRALCI